MGDKTKIDWCDASWNPVTGCYHGCEYCYARGIANRYGGYSLSADRTHVNYISDDGTFELNAPLLKIDSAGGTRRAAYPFRFAPTFHRYHLDQPARWTKPRTISVCSMADLFGEWVPHMWIEEVFKACEAAPQHRYLFLTKNPRRYSDLFMRTVQKNNIWLGTSYTGTCKYERTAVVRNSFLSIEPLLCRIPPLTAHSIALWNDWVIIGAETGNRKDKVKPEKEWIDTIVRSCEAVGTPVFMKESLRDLMGDDFKQEYPWEV